jgi:hypothetical protein
VGPQGATGAQGIQGIQGIQGLQGPAGLNGTNAITTNTFGPVAISAVTANYVASTLITTLAAGRWLLFVKGEFTAVASFTGCNTFISSNNLSDATGSLMLGGVHVMRCVSNQTETINIVPTLIIANNTAIYIKTQAIGAARTINWYVTAVRLGD